MKRKIEATIKSDHEETAIVFSMKIRKRKKRIS